MVLSVFDDWYSVRTIRQKQSKDSQTAKNDNWRTNRHMSTQSPPNTQSRANAATLRKLHCCHRLNVRVHSSKVELAAAGVHPVGVISSHASV